MRTPLRRIAIGILTTALAALSADRAAALDVMVVEMASAICNQPMGRLTAVVNSGVPPYTFEWSNGATTQTNLALYPGTYSVTVTDATLEQVTVQGTVNNLDYYPQFGPPTALNYCPGEVPMVSFFAGTQDGAWPGYETGTAHGPGPYSFNAPGFNLEWEEDLRENCGVGLYSYYNIKVPGAPPGQFFTVNYTDGTGCPGDFSFQVPFPSPLQPQVLSVTGSCSNGAIGSALVYAGTGNVKTRRKNSAGQYIGGYCASQSPVADGTVLYTGMAPGDYWVMVDHDLFSQYHMPPLSGSICRDSVLVTIPDLGTTCGLVSGRVYVDGNANCAFNGGENLVPGTIVEITPGPSYAVTNASGNFSLQLPYGTYTFTEQHPVLVQSCPAQATVSSPLTSNVNVACAPGAQLDVQLSMACGPARPGFQLRVDMDLDNLTPNPTGTVSLAFTFDPALSIVSVSPPATSTAGNVITWTAPQLTMTSAFQHRDITVFLQVPPDVGLIGSTLSFSAELMTQNADADLANNSASINQLVTGSYDPNDKLATTSTGGNAVYLIDQDEWVDYIIRFQNTGTDTAFNVVITDTLPPALDPATILWGAASHAHTRQLLGQSVLKFIFPNILLPDSNVNEPLSHGFVSFRIRPKQPVLPGTIVENIANIYFDFNPPVITEPSVLVAEFSTGMRKEEGATMQLQPNPTNGPLRVRLVGPLNAPGMMRVIGADGRVVAEQRTLGMDVHLDVRSLEAGPYLLEWRVANDRYLARFIRE